MEENKEKYVTRKEFLSWQFITYLFLYLVNYSGSITHSKWYPNFLSILLLINLFISLFYLLKHRKEN